MTLLYYEPVFQEHDTGSLPENGGRILAAVRHLSFVGLDSICRRPAWEAASMERLSYVHTRDYLESLERFADQGGGYIEQDTFVCKKSFAVARMATGAVCDAVARVVAGDDKNAFCLVRPPGHHALSNQAMGFCLLNNIAVGARVATRELGLERVLIVDFDVHHGNGTQAIFWEDADVGFFSMHRSPFYPGTGAADEIGAGAGLGTTLNVPIQYGTSREEQLLVFAQKLAIFADRIKPQLVMVSAGFDGHKDDPIGSLGLETEDFQVLTSCVVDVANRYADARVVSVLEGGYNPEAMTDCIALHLEELLET